MKVLSVITICKNASHCIEAAISSIRMIKQPFIEYIIIDGGSTDGTVSLIENNLDIIDFFISEADSGISNAFNKGVKFARGEYILFLNADDYHSDNFINNFFKIYNINPIRYDVYYSDLRALQGNVATLAHKPNHLELFWKMSLYHPSTFVRSEVLRKFMFDESFRIAMDYKLLLGIFINRGTFKYFESDGVIFRKDGISSKFKSNIYKGYKEVLKAQFQYGILTAKGINHFLILSTSLLLGRNKFQAIVKVFRKVNGVFLKLFFWK